MNFAQIHLLLNHLPVIIPLVGASILAIGILGRSSTVQKIGLWLLLVSALVAIPAYLTGEPAESLLKNYPGVSREAMHRHQDAAIIALISIEIVGLISVILLIMGRKSSPIPNFIFGIQFIFILSSLILMARAAHLGGEIRHEEIQSAEIIQSS